MQKSEILKKQGLFFIFPIMMVFFSMGFVDSVGFATNYIKDDFELSDTIANMFPFMVFLWFFVFSVPTGVFMGKYGRKKAVLASMIITILAVLLPLIQYNMFFMMSSFALLGIGNAIMQVSANPLVSNFIQGKKLSSYLTFGQFMKAVCALLGPIIATFMFKYFQNWRLVYLVFLVQGIFAFLMLQNQDIEQEELGSKINVREIFGLLKNPLVLMFFFGIMCHVGIDVGVNVSAPKILKEKLGMQTNEALHANMVYFVFRTIASFVGAMIMVKYSSKKFFVCSMFILIFALAGLFFANSELAFLVCFALIGFGNANVFPILYSSSVSKMKDKSNELSSLMVMGISGGAILPLIMGVASDFSSSQLAPVAVMIICVLYLIIISRKV